MEQEAMDSSAVVETSTDETHLESSLTETEQSMDESFSVVREAVTESVKKRKRTGPVQQQSGPTPKRKGRSSAGKAPTRLVEEPDGEQLYDIVLGGRSALQSVVSEWVERYQTDPEAAMLEMVQFFVQCSGCRATISRDMFRNQEASTVIRSLTENFAEESGEYPLVMGGAQARKFKVNFSEFIERLVEQCQHSIIYDEYMLDTLVMWLVGFTDSQVRAFRHTCSLACMKLTTAVVHVATSVTAELDNTQRQADSERRRSGSQRGAGKLQRLERKQHQLEAQLKELQEVMNTVFTSVFVHRYRDTRPEIRALCISELGVWMKDYSVHFLDDQYLKYIGWTLYDKSADVRLQSILALQPLYSSTELFPHLDLFTQKFKERLVSMRLDREESVAVSALVLCGSLLSLEVLEEEECVEICELVFFDSRSIAQAAGAFAAQYLFSEEFMSKARQAKPPRGKKKATDEQIKLKEIVHFFVDSRIHQHAVYLVDSLWDHTNVLRNWEAMTTLLLDGSCGVELSAQEEKALVEVLACAVRRAGGSAPSALKGKGKAMSARERRAVEQDKEAIASKLIPVLPDLISKFGTEVESAVNLASIPQHFDLEMYVELRAQKHLENLLTHLKEMVMKHTASEVLDECAMTFHHMLDADFSLHSSVSVVFGQLADELLASLKHWLGVVREESMIDEDSENVYNTAVVLRRTAAFYKSVDLTHWEFSEELLVVVDAAVDADCCEMLAVPAITCLKMHLLWKLKALDEDSPDREALRSLRNLTDRVMTQNCELLRFGLSGLQTEAFCSLCDLLVAFSSHLHNHGVLGVLAYTPDRSMQSSMCEYVMEHVFGEEEEEQEPATEEEVLSQAEALNNKRVLLAGFLKLVIYSVIDATVAAPVFGQYVKHFLSYGDLIKMAVTRSREANPISWYKTILLSLQQLYTGLLEDTVVVDYESPDWTDIKDLAHRFVLTMGFDQLKFRQPLVGIHRDGIRFALANEEESEEEAPPPHLAFLDVLAEFSYRLLDVDRSGQKGVLSFLKEQLGEGVLEKVESLEGWEPLHRYVASLAGEEGGLSTSVNTSRVGGKKRAGKTTKRKQPEGDDTRQQASGRGNKAPHLQPDAE